MFIIIILPIRLIIWLITIIIKQIIRCVCNRQQEEGTYDNVPQSVPTNYGSVQVNPPPPPNRQPTFVQPTGARITEKV